MREKTDNTGIKSEGQNEKAKYNFQKIELVARKHFFTFLNNNRKIQERADQAIRRRYKDNYTLLSLWYKRQVQPDR